MKFYVGRDIVSKLLNRFFLLSTPIQETSLVLNQSIQPVTNVDRFPVVSFYQSTIPITSTGQKTIIVVPPGKRFIVYAMEAEKASGTFTFDNFKIVKPIAGQTSQAILLKNVTAATTINYLPTDGNFKCPTGWSLTVNVAAKTDDGTAIVKALVEEEDDV